MTPPNVEPTTDDDESLGDISLQEVYHRRSTKVSIVTPDGGIREPFCKPWTELTEKMHHGMTAAVVACATFSARRPEIMIVAISALAFGLVIVGFFTNFKLELDFEKVLTPLGSAPAAHYSWINSPEGFPNKVRNIIMLFHRDGDNVLSVDAMERVMIGVDIVRSAVGFQELCDMGGYVDFEGTKTCRIMSASGYWKDHNLDLFYEETKTDAQLQHRVSNFTFANGAPVYHDAILGNWEKDDTGNITFSQSYLVTIDIPDDGKGNDADAYEVEMLAALDKQRREWIKEDAKTGQNNLVMDVMTIYAYEIEIMRAIQDDLYLVPLVAFIMCGFVAITMMKFGTGGSDKLKSRGILGIFAVYTIGMSYLAGNGLMFLCGVPFTTITQILPFVVVGIGLDDTFIITGEYFRTDPRLDTIERIRMTMNEVSHSICLTTISTTLAFLLGLMSSLPGVRWLCIYAFTTIAIDFVFQITLFMAFIVMDERRIQAHRKDILCCLKTDDHPDNRLKKTDSANTMSKADSAKTMTKADSSPAMNDGDSKADDEPHTGKGRRGTVHFADLKVVTESAAKERRASEMPGQGGDRRSTMGRRRTSIARRVSIFDAKSIPQQIMVAYSEILMKPAVKGLVLLIFAGFFALCCWSCTNLTQEFSLGDYVPADSYLKDVLFTLENYASVVRPMAVYFRDMDQADPNIQQQMINYVEDLEALKQISSSIDVDLTGTDFEGIDEVKPFCWVRDFTTLLDQYENDPDYAFLVNLDFTAKLNFALNDPIVRELYGQDIIIDEESGNITGSRCWLFLSELDLNSIEAQLEMLHDQRAVGSVQPLNVGKFEGDWNMFFFDQLLFYWEAYDVAIQELIFTIISGVVALAIIAFVMIPHWTAVFVVVPMISMIYINYLGTLQLFGMHINGIFYICIVVAIGLLVDFLMHVLLKYYETSPTKTRDERVKETLETMGASILLGGLTTFLGVVPLVFSTTKIFFSVFLAFFGMVLLGVTHGLILLPVILSLIGPTTGIAAYEEGVTTFETSVYGAAASPDALMAELREIEKEAIKRESGAAGEAPEAPAMDNSNAAPPEEATAAEPESNSDQSGEIPPPKRNTLTQVYV